MKRKLPRLPIPPTLPLRVKAALQVAPIPGRGAWAAHPTRADVDVAIAVELIRAGWRYSRLEYVFRSLPSLSENYYADRPLNGSAYVTSLLKQARELLRLEWAQYLEGDNFRVTTVHFVDADQFGPARYQLTVDVFGQPELRRSITVTDLNDRSRFLKQFPVLALAKTQRMPHSWGKFVHAVIRLSQHHR